MRHPRARLPHCRKRRGPGPRSGCGRTTAARAHTFHKAASAGSRCISCHMSDVNWRLLIRRRDHTFQPPVPETTVAFGVPNACTTCHDERTPEWAARQMDQWWGDGERRKASAALADTMYRAGSGDATVLPALARLAVDRTQGILVRASAVEFMEQLALGTAGTASADAKSQTSFADGQLASTQKRVTAPVTLSVGPDQCAHWCGSDPEPTVRAQAVTAMLASGDRARVLTPIVARLVDPARVVRARAAEALLSLGVATLPGAAGVALERAQDELGGGASGFSRCARQSRRAWMARVRARSNRCGQCGARSRRRAQPACRTSVRRPGGDSRPRRKISRRRVTYGARRGNSSRRIRKSIS